MVGDDAVVHHEKLVGGIGGVWVAVVSGGGPVGGPARVPDAAVVLEVHIAVQVLLRGDLRRGEERRRGGAERRRMFFES